MAIDYAALKVEIAKPAYNGLSDAAIADAINRSTSFAPDRFVPTAEIASLWARREVLGAAAERANRAALTAAQRALAWSVLTIVEHDGFAGLDPRNPAQKTAMLAFFDRLVTDTIMTAGDRTATVALINAPQTGPQAFGGTLDSNDIVRARALP